MHEFATPLSHVCQSFRSKFPYSRLLPNRASALSHPDLTDVKFNRLSRFQLLQAMHQHFWKRWRADYLHQLQQQHKWRASTAEP